MNDEVAWIFCGITKRNEEVFCCLDLDLFEIIKTCSTFFDERNKACLFYDKQSKKLKTIKSLLKIKNQKSSNQVFWDLTRNNFEHKKNYCPMPLIEEKREAIALRFKVSHLNLKSKQRNRRSVSNSNGEQFLSVDEAAIAYSISKASIYSACSGHRKTAATLKWKFDD